jgi:tripartite-type tricarboxylate transporter receptor subunit TctC
MKLHRRNLLYGAAGAIALLVRPRIARAQAYPTRSVHLIVGFPAGFTPDIIARLTAQSLSERRIRYRPLSSKSRCRNAATAPAG